MDLLEFIDKSNKVNSSEDLFSLLETVMGYYGFDRVLFSLMTDHTEQGQEAGHGLMRNYPDDWMKEYDEKEYQDIDPVRQYVLQASIPFSWKVTEEQLCLNSTQKKFMNEAKEAGLHNGIAFPLRGPLGALAGIGAASSEKKNGKNTQASPEKLSLLNAACQQFYVAYTTLENKSKSSGKEQVYLTPRETEILSWCAHGKTTWEISIILNLSEAGVLFHLRNVMKKFATSSRVYAVMQAVRMGIIQL